MSQKIKMIRYNHFIFSRTNKYKLEPILHSPTSPSSDSYRVHKNAIFSTRDRTIITDPIGVITVSIRLKFSQVQLSGDEFNVTLCKTEIK